VSLPDWVDLSTSAGRMLTNVLASVAQFDNEVRAERIRAGQSVARESGSRHTIRTYAIVHPIANLKERGYRPDDAPRAADFATGIVQVEPKAARCGGRCVRAQLTEAACDVVAYPTHKEQRCSKC
jgi:DNA invertase Pin-like site-specific DNA recombinase